MDKQKGENREIEQLKKSIQDLKEAGLEENSECVQLKQAMITSLEEEIRRNQILQVLTLANITSVNAWFETMKEYMGTELVTSFYKKADLCHKTDIIMEALKYKNDYVKHSAVDSLVKLKQYDLADFLFEEMISDLLKFWKQREEVDSKKPSVPPCLEVRLKQAYWGCYRLSL